MIPTRIWSVPTGVDEGVRAGAGGGVQAIDQVLDRRVLGARVVVLKFHEADDIGVERGDGADDLGALAAKLKGGAGTARRREPATSAVAVEVVEHVEAGDLHVATHGSGSWRPRVRVDEGDRRRVDGLHPIDAEPLIEDPSEGRQGVAHPQRVGGAQP
jgi:hypothetical protein